MFLITGLGNPGAAYENNRHNAGFMAADSIARRHSFSPWSRKFRGEIADGTIAGEKVLLLKPSTFMNLSGDSVGEAMRFYKIPLSGLIVMHDELDLPPGKVRVKTGGGHGGHNGLKSIDAHCGKDYRRLRIGIGHPGDKTLVHNHVLGDFAKADQTWLSEMLDGIAEHIGLLMKGDESTFMNRLSGAAKPSAGATVTKAAAQPAGQSHIRQARQSKPKIEPTGPMAEMLKKLLGNKDG